MDLQDYAFQEEDMEELCALLKKYHHTKVDLSDGNIRNGGAKHLAQCTELVYLSLNHNDVGDEGVKALIQLPKLQELHLCRNNLTNTGAELLLAISGANFRATVYANSRVGKKIIEMLREKNKSFNNETKPNNENSAKLPQSFRSYNPGLWLSGLLSKDKIDGFDKSVNGVQPDTKGHVK